VQRFIDRREASGIWTKEFVAEARVDVVAKVFWDMVLSAPNSESDELVAQASPFGFRPYSPVATENHAPDFVVKRIEPVFKHDARKEAQAHVEPQQSSQSSAAALMT